MAIRDNLSREIALCIHFFHVFSPASHSCDVVPHVSSPKRHTLSALFRLSCRQSTRFILMYLIKAAASDLPPHCPYNHRIDLLSDATPKFGPIYNLSNFESIFKLCVSTLTKILRKVLSVTLSRPPVHGSCFFKKRIKICAFVWISAF